MLPSGTKWSSSTSAPGKEVPCGPSLVVAELTQHSLGVICDDIRPYSSLQRIKVGPTVANKSILVSSIFLTTLSPYWPP